MSNSPYVFLRRATLMLPEHARVSSAELGGVFKNQDSASPPTHAHPSPSLMGREEQKWVILWFSAGKSVFRICFPSLWEPQAGMIRVRVRVGSYPRSNNSKTRLTWLGSANITRAISLNSSTHMLRLLVASLAISFCA